MTDDSSDSGSSKRSETAAIDGGDRALDAKRKKQLVGAGVAVGIGSAAIVAALLYANRGRRGGRSD